MIDQVKHPNRLEAVYMALDPEDRLRITWEQIADDYFVGYRSMPGMNVRAELPQLNGDMARVFELMELILQGTIDPEMITPCPLKGADHDDRSPADIPPHLRTDIGENQDGVCPGCGGYGTVHVGDNQYITCPDCKTK